MDISAIREHLESFLVTSALNRMYGSGDERIWDTPLVGVSRGDDPLFADIQRDIGAPALTPHEYFATAFPDSDAQPHELSVICYALPHTSRTKAENAQATDFPSERWCRSRVLGERANIALAQSLADMLCAQGIEAVAPITGDGPRAVPHEKYTLACPWSERHAAYVSGLGTFSLCRGLITPLGKAVRLGSVIARLPLPVTSRPYTSIYDYCLYYFDGSCRACEPRCPQHAVSPDCRDKLACREMVYGHTPQHYGDSLGFTANGCGLCQTRVPCMDGIPAKIRQALKIS